MAAGCFLLGQISDLHVQLPGELAYGIVDCAAMLEGCVEEILRLPQRPDALVVTGDLVDRGHPEEYVRVRQLLAPLPMPWYVIPGNHDDREAMRAALSDHAYLRQSPGFLQYAIDDWPVRIVALDTVIPGEGGGRLDAERLAWLERTLSSDKQRPTVVILHHPPFPTLIQYMDGIGLQGADRLAQVIARHPQVERVLAGHLHRPIHYRFAGTIASTCPSPAHQVALDLSPDAPGCFCMEPPGFQLHAWREGMGIVSHTAFIGDFAGPYRFRGD